MLSRLGAAGDCQPNGCNCGQWEQFAKVVQHLNVSSSSFSLTEEIEAPLKPPVYELSSQCRMYGCINGNCIPGARVYLLQNVIAV